MKKTRNIIKTPKVEGLTKPQVRCLLALRNGRGLTKRQLADKAKVSFYCMTEFLGSVDPEILVKHPTCLVAQRLVKATTEDIEGAKVKLYTITKKGFLKIKDVQSVS